MQRKAMAMTNKHHRIIGVDFDDVLLNFNDAFLDFHNSEYGTSHKREHITTWHLEDVYDLTFEEMHKRIHAFYGSAEYKNAPTVVGAIEGIAQLAKNNTLHIITAAPEEIKAEIEVWIGRHFPDVFKEIHFTRKDLFDKNPKKKTDICKALGIEVFIDDSLQNAESMAAIGIPVFLIDVPWNQGRTSPPITRVYSWEEIIKKLT